MADEAAADQVEEQDDKTEAEAEEEQQIETDEHGYHLTTDAGGTEPEKSFMVLQSGKKEIGNEIYRGQGFVLLVFGMMGDFAIKNGDRYQYLENLGMIDQGTMTRERWDEILNEEHGQVSLLASAAESQLEEAREKFLDVEAALGATENPDSDVVAALGLLKATLFQLAEEPEEAALPITEDPDPTPEPADAGPVEEVEGEVVAPETPEPPADPDPPAPSDDLEWQ